MIAFRLVAQIQFCGECPKNLGIKECVLRSHGKKIPCHFRKTHSHVDGNIVRLEAMLPTIETVRMLSEEGLGVTLQNAQFERLKFENQEGFELEKLVGIEFTFPTAPKKKPIRIA